MTRLPDWPALLHAYLESRRDRPFAWGAHDCASFAAGAVEAITGDRLDDVERSSALVASRLAARGEGLAELVDARLGARLPGKAARRGDVVLLEQDGRLSLGVVVGQMIATPGVRATLLVPRSRAIASWRVG